MDVFNADELVRAFVVLLLYVLYSREIARLDLFSIYFASSFIFIIRKSTQFPYRQYYYMFPLFSHFLLFIYSLSFFSKFKWRTHAPEIIVSFVALNISCLCEYCRVTFLCVYTYISIIYARKRILQERWEEESLLKCKSRLYNAIYPWDGWTIDYLFVARENLIILFRQYWIYIECSFEYPFKIVK